VRRLRSIRVSRRAADARLVFALVAGIVPHHRTEGDLPLLDDPDGAALARHRLRGRCSRSPGHRTVVGRRTDVVCFGTTVAHLRSTGRSAVEREEEEEEDKEEEEEESAPECLLLQGWFDNRAASSSGSG